MKHLKGINESLGNGEQEFTQDFDVMGMFSDDEEIEFEIQDNIETELYNITQSFYPESIEVDMNNSTDSKDIQSYVWWCS